MTDNTLVSQNSAVVLIITKQVREFVLIMDKKILDLSNSTVIFNAKINKACY